MSGASQESLGPRGLPALGKACLTSMNEKLSTLSEKVDRLLRFQEDITGKLQALGQGLGHLQGGLHQLEAACALGSAGANSAPSADTQAIWPEVLELLRAVQQEASQHGARLEALCRMVAAANRALALEGATFQNLKLVDFVVQGIVPWREGSLADSPEENKEQAEKKGAKPKCALSPRGVHVDTTGPRQESQKVDLPEGTVEQLSPISASGMGADLLIQAGAASRQGDGVPGPGQLPPGQSLLLTKAEAKAPETFSRSPGNGLELSGAPNRVSEVPASQEVAPSAGQGAPSRPDPQLLDEGKRLTSGHSPLPRGPRRPRRLSAQPRAAPSDGETSLRISTHMQEMDSPEEVLVTPGGSLALTPATHPPEAPAAAHPGQKRSSHGGAEMEEVRGPEAEPTVGPSLVKRDEGDETAEALDLQQDKGLGARNPDPGKDGVAGGTGRAQAGSRTPLGAEAGIVALDAGLAPPAPFEHRVVSVKESSVSAGYTVCWHEVLGGGRFGQVHRCTEQSTGLPLAAKIIKVKSAKDRGHVRNEVNIMNQLSHVNLIQLYDAFESKNSFTLIMEYVDGGELFDRITDERYHLTELDVALFTRQICEGVRHLHQHYILHLDLKPENILCVSHTGHHIKIIDFGLARRYKPREKLKVNFGTPEFLAPEVVNYEFVSFPTDMWSVGVITYMLLSGLSPFLGETDAETMNFIVNCSWDFNSDTFEGLSEEAKDFVSRLLIKEKSCRMSAAQSLKHEWLNNLPAKASTSKVGLKSQLLLQKYMAQRKWKKHFYAVTAANRLRKFPTGP
ncbi:myosin light chain kinase 3 isoform X2 [Nycticebus coucang]|uniref:myosin light chain kinase 3 isoform X2 n=1 Tax=Nycticebus coucang TaxID=9470 RepID=UPI00234CE249|nr:myosin light chain kinase 3 isoform X2 [Nycticebus coucang]